MKLQEMMERIRLPEDAQRFVMENAIEEERYQALKREFYKDSQTFFEYWNTSENRLQWILVFYLKLVCEVYEAYQADGISDKVFNDTFYDITLWCEECYRKYNVWGLEEVKWIANSIHRKLYRLGRLQFEPLVLTKELAGEHVKLEGGSSVLNIHIPAGEKMDYEACLDSLKQAEDFFGDSYIAYMCDSWLLSPVLKEFLPENSNIIKFQNLFEIIRVYHDYPQAERRIFQDIREDKENYPERSSLQKAAKRYILKGNDLGIGVGIFYK